MLETGTKGIALMEWDVYWKEKKKKTKVSEFYSDCLETPTLLPWNIRNSTIKENE